MRGARSRLLVPEQPCSAVLGFGTWERGQSRGIHIGERENAMLGRLLCSSTACRSEVFPQPPMLQSGSQSLMCSCVDHTASMTRALLTPGGMEQGSVTIIINRPLRTGGR